MNILKKGFSLPYFKRFMNNNTLRYSSQYVNHRDTPDNNESVPFEFTPESYKEIDVILAKYPSNYKKSGIIPLLFIAQKQNDNFLSLPAMKKVAKILGVGEMDVFEVASFYTMYNRSRVGKFHLQICGTTPCQLCGAESIIEACETHLGIKTGETTPDGLFTIQEVECLGACVNAPMMQVNNEYVYEDLTPENVVQLLENLKNGTDKKGPQNHRKNCEGPQGKTSLNSEDYTVDQIFDRDFGAAKKEWDDAKEAAKQAAAAQQQKKINETLCMMLFASKYLQIKAVIQVSLSFIGLSLKTS